jgi:hypothetical protein
MRGVLAVLVLLPALAAAGEVVLPDVELHRPPAHPKAGGRSLLDCAWRNTWNPPKGWEAAAVGRDVFAWAPDRTAVIVRGSAPQRDLDRGRELAAQLAGAALAFTEPVKARKHKWRTTTTLSGSGTRDGQPVEVKIVQEWRGFARDLLWVEVAIGAQRADLLARMDAARDGALQLVSHACECKTDCDPRR